MMAAIQAQAVIAIKEDGSLAGALPQMSQPPPIDENVLNRFIEGKQLRLAFELVYCCT